MVSPVRSVQVQNWAANACLRALNSSTLMIAALLQHVDFLDRLAAGNIPVSAAVAQTVLIITAALLFWMAATDLREFKIRNNFVLVLVGLFFLHAMLSGRWVVLHWNLIFAAVMFLLLLMAYSRRLLGGGDVKLLTTAFLWSGLHCAVPFLLIVTAASLVQLFAARLGWIGALRENGRLRLAYAPAIASGLIGIFLLGCLAPIAGARAIPPVVSNDQ
jgi:prepilin peptidase CpaA